MKQKTSVAIIGATGFTGHELVKILHNHPLVNIAVATTTSQEGKLLSAQYPDLIGTSIRLETFSIERLKASQVELAFLAVHHGTAMEFAVKLLEAGIKVVDLSADFRFKDQAVYERTYVPHTATGYLEEAVYGLCEVNRKKIKKARLIGNPGCYVTSVLLPLLPIRRFVSEILVDAKSGVSGAGRKADDAFIFANVYNNFKAYGIAKHRHQPEIEAYLGKNIEFVPHLLPINRGILSTIYFKSKKSLRELRDILVRQYANEPFVEVLEDKDPTINMVAGTNRCFINIYSGTQPGRFVIVSVLDNLIKGASGQAVQNMNLMLGFPEETGLLLSPSYV